MNPFSYLVAGSFLAASLLALYALPQPASGWAAGVLGACAGCALLCRWAPGQPVVARLKGLTWDRQTFCQHFLITGATGSGKTLSGIVPLLFQVFQHQPRFGGLCVDVKGVLHEIVIAMATHFGRAEDVLLLEVGMHTPPGSTPPKHRFNLVGDRSIPYATYARCVVDTAIALGNRHEQAFFRRAAQIHIAKALEALDALGLAVTLENTHNLLVNSTDTHSVLQQLEARETTRALAEHFRNYLAQPPEAPATRGTLDGTEHTDRQTDRQT